MFTTLFSTMQSPYEILTKMDCFKYYIILPMYIRHSQSILYCQISAREIFIEELPAILIMSSRREEDRKSRSMSEEKKTAATHKTPSIMVQLPCARGSSWSFGSKKAEKKMERKESPASHTITMADFEKGEAPALIIPEDTGDLDGAVFDTATFERGPLTPLHAPQISARVEFGNPFNVVTIEGTVPFIKTLHHRVEYLHRWIATQGLTFIKYTVMYVTPKINNVYYVI